MPHLLHATDITRRFGAIEALRGAELRAAAGRVTGLIGPNGAGKSTLLACIAGLDEPDGGVVMVDGQPTGRARHATTVFLVPDGARPWVDQTVEQVLSFFAAVHGAPAALVAELHEALLLTALRAQRVGEQTDVPAYAWVKRTPSAAMRSMFGVLTTWFSPGRASIRA